MIHYSDDELSWHTLRAEGEIERHVEGCEDCARRLGDIVLTDADLSERGTWSFPADLRRGGDRVREELEDMASRLAQETADARVALREIISQSVKFAYDGIEPALQTAGAVLVLCEAAHEAAQREPVHGRNLADAALAIGNRLSATDHYLGKTVNQLIGLAQKERANAFQYLGNLSAALDALDGARVAHRRAEVSDWEQATLLYTRGTVLYRSAHPDAAACADESAAVFARLDDWTRFTHARMLWAAIRYWAQDYLAARDEYRCLIPLAERERDEVLVARLSASATNCDLEMGDAGGAEKALLPALTVFERSGLLPDAAIVRWALARIPILRGEIAAGTKMLRDCKLQCERLELTNDAALITLDLVEVLLLTEPDRREIKILCHEIERLFRRQGMLNQAEAAMTYLRAAIRNRTVKPDLVRHVRRFLARLAQQPTVRFRPLAA